MQSLNVVNRLSVSINVVIKLVNLFVSFSDVQQSHSLPVLPLFVCLFYLKSEVFGHLLNQVNSLDFENLRLCLCNHRVVEDV